VGGVLCKLPACTPVVMLVVLFVRTIFIPRYEVRIQTRLQDQLIGWTGGSLALAPTPVTFGSALASLPPPDPTDGLMD
jgi:hypothetical protein